MVCVRRKWIELLQLILLQEPFTKVIGKKVNITAQVKLKRLFSIFTLIRSLALCSVLGCLSNPKIGLLHRGQFKLGNFHGAGISYRPDGSYTDSTWNNGTCQEEQLARFI